MRFRDYIFTVHVNNVLHQTKTVSISVYNVEQLEWGELHVWYPIIIPYMNEVGLSIWVIFCVILWLWSSSPVIETRDYYTYTYKSTRSHSVVCSIYISNYCAQTDNMYYLYRNITRCRRCIDWRGHVVSQRSSRFIDEWKCVHCNSARKMPDAYFQRHSIQCCATKRRVKMFDANYSIANARLFAKQMYWESRNGMWIYVCTMHDC